MLPVVRQLLELQQIDNELTTMAQKAAEVPKLHEAVKQRLAEAAGQLEDARKAVAESDARVSALEKKILDYKNEVTRIRQRQLQVKTNQEYQAALKESDHILKQISDVEDDVLEAMEMTDTLRRELSGAEQRLAQAREESAGELKNLEDSLRFLESEQKILGEKKAALSQTITAPHLALYNKLFSACHGTVVAKAENELCQGCRVMIRPQHYQEILLADRIMQCENCRRILYAEE